MAKLNLDRNLKILFWMNLFLSMYTLTPVTTLFYLERGLSFSQLFLLSVVFSVAVILFEVPTGVIADKVGRKKSIIIGIVFYIFHTIGYLFAQGFLQMAIAFSLFAIGFTFLSGVVEAYIYDLLKSEGKQREMKKWYGHYLSASKVPALIIPILAVFIAKDLLNWQFQVLILINVFTNVVALVLSCFLQRVKQVKESEDSFVLLKKSWNLFRDNANFRQIFWNSALIYVPFQLFWRIWQPYLVEFSVSIILLGVIVVSHNAVTFFLQRHIYKIEEKIGLEKLIFLTSLFPFIGYFILGFTRSLILSLIGIYLVFIMSVSRRPLISDYMNSHIESKNRSTALSMQSMLSNVIQIVMMLLTAYLTVYHDYAGIYIAIVMVGIGLVFFRLNGDHVAQVNDS